MAIRRIAIALALAAFALPLGPRGAAAQRADDVLRGLVEGLAAQPVVAGERVERVEQIARLYAASGYAPLWPEPKATALRRALLAAENDGLDPWLYHLEVIDALAGEHPGPASRRATELDVLRTAALVALVHDLRWGRARPTSVARVPAGADDQALARLVGAADLGAEIAALRPDHFTYRGLGNALARLRAIERSGGWLRLPPGDALRPGTFDARVVLLRQRLASEGYLRGTLRPTADFDSTLASAVRAFQHHHGLNEDGIVGRTTVAELNVPVGGRIDQVRINLERARWIAPSLPDTFLVVNIAGAKLYLIRDGAIVHEARVIVGRDYTRTPVFSGRLERIELNPYWTVPESIVDEVLAAAGREPGYLERQRFRALDEDGRPVAVSAAELLSHSAASLPWTLRQDPGPLNPLGRIKFYFPNAFSVYLHDTPARDLFAREERLFSHGCIRVQDPFRLAELLLDEPARWTRASLESAAATDEHRLMPLSRPVFVLIQYWTASTDEHGTLHFYRDVYGRDPALLRELDGG